MASVFKSTQLKLLAILLVGEVARKEGQNWVTYFCFSFLAIWFGTSFWRYAKANPHFWRWNNLKPRINKTLALARRATQSLRKFIEFWKMTLTSTLAIAIMFVWPPLIRWLSEGVERPQTGIISRVGELQEVMAPLLAASLSILFVYSVLRDGKKWLNSEDQIDDSSSGQKL